MRRENLRPVDQLSGYDDRPRRLPRQPDAAATADRFRRLTSWLILASSIVAIALAAELRVPVDPQGTFAIDWLLASLLLVSRMWWDRRGHRRIADALGTLGFAALGGMSCGAIAMLELRLGFPFADGSLRSFDGALGLDGIAFVQAQVRQGPWLMSLLAPAYNYTLQVFFGGLVALSLLGNRVEAWRAAFCFVGTLLTTCSIAAFFPAKGLGVWASEDLFMQLPPNAMRNFWPHFDEFYFGAKPMLRLQVIDGVISFPSFHSVVGFLVLAMWRKNIGTLIAAGVWLTLMLLSIFPGGGHYFIDLLGGLAVWGAWFAWSRHIERQILKQRSGDLCGCSAPSG